MAQRELRDEAGHKFGEAIDDHTLEVKCISKFCGASRDVVVIHRFDLREGTVVTKKFKNPHLSKKE